MVVVGVPTAPVVAGLVVAEEVVAAAVAELGAEPVGSTSVEQDAVLRKQMDQFRPIIATIKME